MRAILLVSVRGADFGGLFVPFPLLNKALCGDLLLSFRGHNNMIPKLGVVPYMLANTHTFSLPLAHWNSLYFARKFVFN